MVVQANLPPLLAARWMAVGLVITAPRRLMNTSSGCKSFWVVMGFATPIFLLSAVRLGIAPLLPQFKQSFGAEYSVLSLIPTAFFLSTVLLAAPLGHLAMQIGLNRCALSIVGLVILSSLLCAATDHLWLLIVFLFVMGMALSAAFPLARTAIDIVYAPGAAGRAMMLIGFPGMLGSILGGILFGRLAEQTGWRNSFVVFAVVGLLLGVFSGVVLFRREYRPRLPKHAAASSRSVLKNRALWLLSLAKGGGYAAGQGVFTFALPMLMDTVGYSPQQVGYVAMLGIVGSMAGMPAGGILSDRRDKKTAVIVGLLGIPPLLLLMPWATRFWQFGGLMIVLSFFISFTYSTTGGALSVVAAPHEQAVASGAFTTISEGIVPLTIGLSGLAASRWGVQTAFVPPLVFAVLGLGASFALKGCTPQPD